MYTSLIAIAVVSLFAFIGLIAIFGLIAFAFRPSARTKRKARRINRRDARAIEKAKAKDIVKQEKISKIEKPSRRQRKLEAQKLAIGKAKYYEALDKQILSTEAFFEGPEAKVIISELKVIDSKKEIKVAKVEK